MTIVRRPARPPADLRPPGTAGAGSRPRSSTSAALVVVAALALTLVAPSAATAGRVDSDRGRPGVTSTEAQPVAQSSNSAYRRRLVYRTNWARRNQGRRVLDQDRCLNAAARRWAVVLAESNGFRHQDLGAVMGRCGLRGAAENLALGYRDADRTVVAWMKSPGHRANILERRHRRIGTGVANGPRGRVTVQLLGWR